MNVLQQLGAGRIAVGAAAWLAPGRTGKLMGSAGNPDSHLTARLFGARDLALGVGTIAFAGEARTAVVKLAALCDALDAAAVFVGIKEGSLGAPTGVLAGGVAIAAAAIGLQSLRG